VTERGCFNPVSGFAEGSDMQIQFNTDNQIDGSDALAERVETELRKSLARFSDHITRLEIHVGDVNAAKGGDDDKRCVIEARLAGRQPEAVRHEAATVDAAIDGATQKLRRFLDGTLGRLTDHKGAPTIRGGS